MGILKGAMTIRRYRVDGEVPEDFRDVFVDAMNEKAFRDPPKFALGAEAVGWCHIQNLLDTDFTVRDNWLMNHFVLAGLRIDKKVLPGKLFRAHLEKRLDAWKAEHEVKRVPASVRAEIKEYLEAEMLSRTLPRVAVYEFCWNIVDGWVIMHTTSESVNDTFRKLFRETFGPALVPFSPLDFLAEMPDALAGLEVVGTSDYRPRDGDQ